MKSGGFLYWRDQKKVADSTVDLNAPFLAGPHRNQPRCPAPLQELRETPGFVTLRRLIRGLSHPRRILSSVAMAHSFLGSGAVTSDAQSRKVASCNVSTGYGGVLPGFQATK